MLPFLNVAILATPEATCVNAAARLRRRGLLAMKDLSAAACRGIPSCRDRLPPRVRALAQSGCGSRSGAGPTPPGGESVRTQRDVWRPCGMGD